MSRALWDLLNIENCYDAWTRRTCILLMTFHPSSTPNMGMYLDSFGNSNWSNTSNVPFSYLMACRVIVVAAIFLDGTRSRTTELRDCRLVGGHHTHPVVVCRVRQAGYATSHTRAHTFNTYINTFNSCFWHAVATIVVLLTIKVASTNWIVVIVVVAVVVRGPVRLCLL